MSKIIIITGASSGFGKTIAELLSSHGNKVYGICRREMSHPQIVYKQGDVRDAEGIEKIVSDIVAKEGRIDVLINNAGMGLGGALELTSWDEIKIQMETNFYGCVNMCQKVLPHMRRQRAGRIINFSSIAGIEGIPYQGFYSCSKFAIEGFSEALSAEVKGFGISVSMVEPGDFATNFTSSRKNSQATLDDPDYGPIFKRSLGLIEKEENGGLKPDVLAQKIEKIVDARHPRLRYVVANFEQWLSVALKRFIPGNWFVDILISYYKSKP
jgi:short-subunit dehydrogenase